MWAHAGVRDAMELAALYLGHPLRRTDIDEGGPGRQLILHVFPSC